MSVSLTAERDRIQRQVEELEQSLSATNADLQLLSNESDAEDSEEEGTQRERIQQEIQNLENVLGEQSPECETGDQFSPQRPPLSGDQFSAQRPPLSGDQFSPQRPPLSGDQFSAQRPPLSGDQFSAQRPPLSGDQFSPQRPPLSGDQFSPQRPPLSGDQFSPQRPPLSGDQFSAQRPPLSGDQFSAQRPPLSGDHSSEESELGVPPSPEGCLQMNLVYQQVLQETLQQLEDLLTNNNRQQKELVSQLSGPIRERPQEQPASSSCQPSVGMYLGRFLKPYFKDKLTSLGPPANQEAREKASRMSGCLDEKQLKIKRLSRDSLRKLIQPKLSKVDYLSQKA
ncbi:hypothetical protein JOQ06_004201, partial [Pogonophryne albipinna]